jgi:CRP-like cAMP-binding protein
MKEQFFEKVRKMSLFATFSDDEFNTVFKEMSLLHVKAGSPLLRQDEHGTTLFLIVEGYTRVIHRQEGERIKLANIEEGGIFGEMAMFDTGPRSADVDAVVDSILLSLKQETLLTLSLTKPHTAFKLLLAIGQVMVKRLREGNHKYIDTLLNVG